MVQRAFVVGAVVAARDGYASANALSQLMPHTQQGLSALVTRVEKRARERDLDL
jgi:hypothetical protein